MEIDSRIMAALGVAYDDKTQSVILTMKTEKGTAVSLSLHPGVVAGLAATLFGVGNQLPRDKGAVTGQPITATGCKGARLPDGRPVLVLQLEGSTLLPVTFPPNAIPVLQLALSELAASTTGASPGKGPIRH